MHKKVLRNLGISYQYVLTYPNKELKILSILIIVFSTERLLTLIEYNLHDFCGIR